MFNVNVFLLAFSLGFIPFVSGATEKDPLPDQIINGQKLDIEIPKAKLPAIMVIDKSLGIKAEFFGDIDQIKNDFKPIFEKTSLLLEHNNQRIYLITS